MNNGRNGPKDGSGPHQSTRKGERDAPSCRARRSLGEGNQAAGVAHQSTETATKRGLFWGAYFREQGIDYGRPHDLYPSNPYPAGSKEAREYDAGYEEAFHGRE